MRWFSASYFAVLERLRGPAAELQRFGNSQSGSLATMFALSLIPVSVAVGAAVDYSFASGAKAHLNAAADAAALSAVSSSSILLTADQAEKSAADFFKTQVINLKRVTVEKVKVKVTEGKKKGRIVVVSYLASTPTAFMGLLNIKTLSISGEATASAAIPTYISTFCSITRRRWDLAPRRPTSTSSSPTRRTSAASPATTCRARRTTITASPRSSACRCVST